MEQRRFTICTATALLLAGAVIDLTAGVLPAPRHSEVEKLARPFVPTLDQRGRYVLAMTQAAAAHYSAAVAEARRIHPEASEVVFPAGDVEAVEQLFKQLQPRYALVFILPRELDVNFAWRWLRLVTEVDSDPFVDVRTGFITGKNAEATARFVRRIRTAVESKAPMPACMVDNLGPNTMAARDAFFRYPGNFIIPVLGKRARLLTISHGTNAFGPEHLAKLDNAGLIHFGGHGYPDRIADGVTSAEARLLKIAPCIVFNGACYTGVTGRWFEMRHKIVEREVGVEDSFCLSILDNNVLGYFAALSPDHGIPVYQEMEFLASHGGSLGETVKYTHDGVVLGNGGKLPDFESFRDGMDLPKWSPADYMLKGTASRVLFGDPAMILTEAFAAPAFEVQLQPEGPDTSRLTAILKNAELKSTFTDTYYSDLSAVQNLFNDRALLTCPVADGKTVKHIELIRAQANGITIAGRLQGFAVEHDAGARLLHIQIDLPATGYMQSAFRVAGATIELKVVWN